MHNHIFLLPCISNTLLKCRESQAFNISQFYKETGLYFLFPVSHLNLKYCPFFSTHILDNTNCCVFTCRQENVHFHTIIIYRVMSNTPLFSFPLTEILFCLILTLRCSNQFFLFCYFQLNSLPAEKLSSCSNCTILAFLNRLLMWTSAGGVTFYNKLTPNQWQSRTKWNC